MPDYAVFTVNIGENAGRIDAESLNGLGEGDHTRYITSKFGENAQQVYDVQNVSEAVYVSLSDEDIEQARREALSLDVA